MSILTTTSKNARKNNNTDREPTEFDGLWLNVGVNMEDEETGETNFVRLNRGIAVDDLQQGKVYASTSPDRAAEITYMNAIVDRIRTNGLSLQEGESMEVAFSVQLYRRQDEAQVVTDPKITKSLDDLFG